MSLAQSMLPEFEQEMATTRKVFEVLPEESFEWKPHEKSMTLVGVATHTANVPHWGATTLSEESFDIEPVAGEPYKEEAAESKAALLEKFDAAVSEMRAALKGASDETMMAPWSLLKTGQALFTMPRVAILRGMIMNHLIHHRAQLSVYLRLLDQPVPAIYGPSADDDGGMG